MGTSRGGPKAGTKSKRKWFKKNVMCQKRRSKDVDLIQDELQALAAGTRSLAAYRDEDAAGGGEHVCVPCARAFVSAAVLADHERTKPHKKRLRVVAEPQYTQREADAGAGMTR